ncbi:MAG: DUF4959 domain-containing protein [Bacteroidales bacterium]|jgi:hypothetical protein|nr:DUF4959 domain-containing protein [Bacteroidales bacterium]
MKRIYFFIISLSVIVLLDRCAQQPNYDDIVRDNIPPHQVTVTDTTNIPGGAIIHFALPPEDNDILGVISRYSRKEGGETIESWTSLFADSIRIEGFADTASRIIQLITVDKSDNRSVPLDVRIHPLTSPLEHIRNSLQVTAGFGSVVVNWKNPTRSSIGILLYSLNDTTGLAADFSYYSSVEEGIYLFKDKNIEDDKESAFSNRPRNFRIQVKDRWGNLSAPLDTILTPLAKNKIPSRDAKGWIWKRFGAADNSNQWRGDFTRNGGQNYFENMFDGDVGNFWGGGVNNTPGQFINGGSNTVVLPIYLTIDLSHSCVICEHKLWHDKNNEMAGQNIKDYELWATNETPKGKDDFPGDQRASLAYWTSWAEFSGTDAWKNEGGWTKIADCHALPNSGSSTPTEDDKVYARENGFTFDIFAEHTGTPFRYVRIVVVSPLWENKVANPRIAEFELYGAVVE